MAKLFVNPGDTDQMPHSVASGLGLHCLPVALLGVSRQKWAKYLDTLTLYHIHFNLFITWFIITRFWIQHGSKMGPKNI